TRGRDDWLGLSRTTLSFATLRRFSTAHCPSGEVHLQSGPTPGDDTPGGARGPARETTPSLEVAPSIYARSPSSMNSAAAGRRRASVAVSGGSRSFPCA